MKRFLAILIAVVFMASALIITGCGGKSQKINGVADEESQVMDEASEASKESLPTTYMVESGDTLWKIAAKADIYGNKDQWPLIYDANRDILDDYKKPLEEGQKLIIPRNISAIEIAAAKEKAKEYGTGGSSSSDYADEESAEDAQTNVAGMSEGSSGSDDYSSSEGSEEGSSDGSAGEPTPIPEQPAKAKKKGGINMMMLLVIALGLIVVVIFFIMSKQKKKEEEEEDKGDTGTKTNILD